MTKKLFWAQPYEKEFEATIIAIRKEGVVLDQTLFYSEGGGQASDRGILKAGNLKFEVEDVFKKGKEIIHHIKSDFQDKLKVGDKVIGIIDWVYRYGLMKAHSSQHIFSAIILRKFNIETTRVKIDFEDVSFNLAQEISYNQLKSAFQETNVICTLDNHEIVGEIISLEEAKKFSNQIRGDIPKEDAIRLIRAENCDLVCCGGTHVQNTTEIGPLVIYSFQKGKDIIPLLTFSQKGPFAGIDPLSTAVSLGHICQALEGLMMLGQTEFSVITGRPGADQKLPVG